MRYPASEKAEIIELVEQSHLPAKRTLDKLGIPRATFYRWYDRYREGGLEALADHRSRPDRVWNRIPDDVRGQIIDLALELPELSPRELAVRFTDERKYFVSEASVYRLLKAHDLITSPAYVVIKAANEFRDKTTAVNQLWQTDFTFLKITGWGWYIRWAECEAQPIVLHTAIGSVSASIRVLVWRSAHQGLQRCAPWHICHKDDGDIREQRQRSPFQGGCITRIT
jgi:transposase-like protein